MKMIEIQCDIRSLTITKHMLAARSFSKWNIAIARSMGSQGLPKVSNLAHCIWYWRDVSAPGGWLTTTLSFLLSFCYRFGLYVQDSFCCCCCCYCLWWCFWPCRWQWRFFFWRWGYKMVLLSVHICYWCWRRCWCWDWHHIQPCKRHRKCTQMVMEHQN